MPPLDSDTPTSLPSRDGTKKPIANRAFTGTFRDYVIWPADSREVMLKLRVTIRVGAAKKILQYRVTPRA